MPTRKERKRLLKEKYFETKQKVWVLLAILAVYIILFSLLSYTINTGTDIAAIIILIIIIIISIPVSVFLIDSITFEYE